MWLLKRNFRLIINKIADSYFWYKKHLAELLFILVVFIIIYSMQFVPYASIIVGFIPSLPYIFAILLGFVILKPHLRKVLKLIVALLLLAFPFAYVRVVIVAELLAEIAYILLFAIIVTYVLRAIRKDFS